MKHRMRKQTLYARIRVGRIRVLKGLMIKIKAELPRQVHFDESYKAFGAAGLMLAAADHGHKVISRIHAPSVAGSIATMRNLAGET